MNNIVSSSVGSFSQRENAISDRMDISIKSLETNAKKGLETNLKDYSHGGNQILEVILQFLQRIEESHHEFKWFKSHEFATKHDLKQMERNIMSKINEFAVRQNAFDDRIETSIKDIEGDINYLTNALSGSNSGSNSGSISQEDQALLDSLDVRASAIADKLEALDALTVWSGSNSSSNSGSVTAPVIGSFVGTFTGTVIDSVGGPDSGSVRHATNATLNGNISGAFTGSMNSGSVDGDYSGTYSGSFSDSAQSSAVLSGSVSGSYTPLSSSALILSRRVKKFVR